MVKLLARRYNFESAGARRYAVAAHVPSAPVGPLRVCDFMAIDCWRSGNFAVHGHEIKISRSDWLKELRDPSKAESFKRYCHYWWLVVPDLSIVRGDTLPPGWGLLVGETTLRAAKVAVPQKPVPMPTSTNVALLRAVAAFGRGEERR